MSEQPQDLYNLGSKSNAELIDFLRTIRTAPNREQQSMMISIHEEIVRRGADIVPEIAALFTQDYSDHFDRNLYGGALNALGFMEGILPLQSAVLESLLQSIELNVADSSAMQQIELNEVFNKATPEELEEAHRYFILTRTVNAMLYSLERAQDSEYLHAFAMADFILHVAGGEGFKAEAVRDRVREYAESSLREKDLAGLLAEMKEWLAEVEEKTREMIVQFITEALSRKLTRVGEKVMFYLWLLTGGDPDNTILEPIEEV